MSAAKDAILARVRAAVTDLRAPVGARGDTPWVDQASAGVAETVELFVENVVDYKAEVVRVAPAGVGEAVAAALTAYGVTSVVVPDGTDPAWTAAVPETVRQVSDDGLSSAVLDGIDAVVTSSAVGIATTGTIVLDHGPGQGRRALSLVPDVHVCVVAANSVVHDVPEAVARLHPQAGMPRPLTWISGPSATSDIELDRVEGVHGPRTLHVILVEGW